MSSKHPPTVEYAYKKSTPPRPPAVSRLSDRDVDKSMFGSDVALCLSCVLLGIIFGLLIGRFV